MNQNKLREAKNCLMIGK